MRKWISFLLMMVLVVMSGTAIAATWVYVCDEDLLGLPMYIDSETVYRDGNSLSFWWKMVENPKEQYLWKMEATLASPRMVRFVPGSWRQVLPDSNEDKAIKIALPYARPGKDPVVPNRFPE